MAGVFGDFVAESYWAGDCYVLFSVPDVDIRGSQLSSRDDLDYMGPPNAESVWIRKRDNETCSALCTGCASYIRWKMGIVQSSAPFWRDLQTSWERHRDSSKVDDVVFFDNEADWRSRRVPEILHTCSLRCSYGPPPRRFAWSKGGTQKRGLNGHGIQLRLRVGVICPFIRAQYCYTGFLPDRVLPAFMGRGAVLLGSLSSSGGGYPLSVGVQRAGGNSSEIHLPDNE